MDALSRKRDGSHRDRNPGRRPRWSSAVGIDDVPEPGGGFASWPARDRDGLGRGAAVGADSGGPAPGIGARERGRKSGCGWGCRMMRRKHIGPDAFSPARRSGAARGTRRIVAILAGALALVAMASAAAAQSSRLEVPRDWDLKPQGVDYGEQFRVLFVTLEVTVRVEDNDLPEDAPVLAVGPADVREPDSGTGRRLLRRSMPLRCAPVPSRSRETRGGWRRRRATSRVCALRSRAPARLSWATPRC